MMTMGDESPVMSLVLPVLLHPVLAKLERKDVSAAQNLQSSIHKMEANNPGFCYDFVNALLAKSELRINITESILKLHGHVPESDDYRCSRSEESFQELNRKSNSLKKILSRIPDEINDRKTFLATIKEIASAIKKLLDAVNEIATFLPSPSSKQALEQRKREFVKFSKRFSNTLKEFFKEGQASAVFTSAIYLIHQTNLIMLTVKAKCE